MSNIYIFVIVIGLLFMFVLVIAYHKSYKDLEEELTKTKEKLEVEKMHSNQWRRKYEDTSD